MKRINIPFVRNVLLFSIFYGFSCTIFAGLNFEWPGSDFFPAEVEIQAVGAISPINGSSRDFLIQAAEGERYKFSLPGKWNENHLKALDMKQVFVRGTMCKRDPENTWLYVTELRTAKPNETKPVIFLPSQRPSRLTRKNGGQYHVNCVRWGPAKKMSGEKTKSPEKESYLFHDTTIEASKLDNIYLGVQSIPPFFKHAFLLFTFSEDSIRCKNKSSSGLVISIEPVRPIDNAKPLAEMLQGALPIVYQIGTWEDFVLYNCERWGQKLSLWQMKFPCGGLSSGKFFDAMLYEATRPRLCERYDMNKNNCSSSIAAALFDYFDSNTAEELRKEFHGTLIITNPRRLPGVLEKLGLLNKQDEILVHPDNYFVPFKDILRSHK
ncbi:MAG: hypothetical protein HQM10_24335 [Candidatus Riflebacteria bacterium]|nr:hypothetical protein [Candidatus Riflebacteria bacterium]